MNEIEFQKLVEESWRGRSKAPDQAELEKYFITHPDDRVLWEAELGLNQSLLKLTDVPVSTNFTSQVLQAVERETVSSPEGRSRSWLNLKWFPRVAIAGLCLCVGLISVQQHHRASRRTEIARDIAAVSTVTTFPHRWLQDFEVINRFSQPPVDDELLAALQ